MTTERDSHTHFDVAVIGAGISGIGAAIRMKEANVGSFALFEKSNDIGGTWRDNTYPGCACDVPSALYSYSFAPNPAWSRAFAGQAEILAYVRHVASRYGVLPHIRFGIEVRRATFDDDARMWTLETNRGRFTARVLVAASGPWHEPKIPAIPGDGTFTGARFHSSRWDHSVDLAGKRVAVVGTGASAIQFVPEIQPRVARLHLFQRTAQWVLPKPNAKVGAAGQWLMRNVPSTMRALRNAAYSAMEAFGVGFRHPAVLEQVQRIGARHLRRAVRDPVLQQKLRPDYTLGCKRLLMSNTYYPAVASPNVELHPTAVKEICGDRIIGADGSEARADVLVFGTGFHILDMPIGDKIADAKGRTLKDHWRGSPRAYLGTSVVGFPNLFLLLGPNLGTGHSSAFSILEAQIAHVVDALTRMKKERLTRVEVRKDVERAFNAEVQEALPRTVYNAGGCSSYYIDENGRNSFSWPWSTDALVARVGRFDPRAYDALPEMTAPPRAAVRKEAFR